MNSYNRRSRRDIGPIAYLIIGLIMGLFIMGFIWSVFGNEDPTDETATQQTTGTNTTATDSIAAATQTPATTVDFSDTNCTMLEDFRDAVNAEVDTGSFPSFSKPYRKVSVEKAKAAALAWSSDAVWTEFVVGYPLEGGPALDYHYYSPSKNKTVSISFGSGGSSVNTPSQPADYQPSHPFSSSDIISTNLWQVTLADAWATAYAQVRPQCAAWWKTISLAWNVSLHMQKDVLVWEFNFFDMSNPYTQWVMVVDATKGSIISKSWNDTDSTTAASSPTVTPTTTTAPAN